MENFLRSKKYLSVSDGIVEPTADMIMIDMRKMEIEGHQLKNLKAKNYFFTNNGHCQQDADPQ